MRHLSVVLLAVSLAVPMRGHATPATPPMRSEAIIDSDGVLNMETMVVTGVQPGRACGRFRDGHSLWCWARFLHASGIRWKADEVNAILEHADRCSGARGGGSMRQRHLKGLMLGPRR